MKEYLEIGGSAANFAGGIVLLVDALRVKSSLGEKEGANDFLEAMRAENAEGMVKDPEGERLDTATAMEMWLSNRSLRRAWIGFALMTAGFGCEIASHFVK